MKSLSCLRREACFVLYISKIAFWLADVMRDNWQLASVLQFVSTFGTICSLPRAQVDVVEADLQGTNDPLIQLPELAEALATAAGAGSEVATIETWLKQTPAEKIGDMYDWMLSLLSSAKIRDALEAGLVEARVPPAGSTGTGRKPRIYYLLDDNRVYYAQGDRWKCAAWDVESWSELIKTLESAKASTGKPARELAAYLAPVFPLVEKYHRELATDSRRRAKHRRIAFQVENRKRSSRLLAAERIDQDKVEAAALKVQAEKERKWRESEQIRIEELKQELQTLRQLLLEHEGRVTRLYEQRADRLREIASLLGVDEQPPPRQESIPDMDLVSTLKI